MRRVRASLAASMASIERGTLSGSEWTWMSMTPLRLCAESEAEQRRKLAHHFLFILHPDGRAPRNLPVLLLHTNVIVGVARLRVRVRVCEVHLRSVTRLCVNGPIVLHQRHRRQRSGPPDERFDRR